MEQQGTVNNGTFVLLNFRSIILAPTIYHVLIDGFPYLPESIPKFRVDRGFSVFSLSSAQPWQAWRSKMMNRNILDIWNNDFNEDQISSK